MLIFGSLLVKLLLVKYSNTCLRLFVVVLQDLHCLQRFYHNVDHCFTIIPIFTFGGAFVIVRYSNACLSLFVVVLQDLHCLQRF